MLATLLALPRTNDTKQGTARICICICPHQHIHCLAPCGLPGAGTLLHAPAHRDMLQDLQHCMHALPHSQQLMTLQHAAPLHHLRMSETCTMKTAWQPCHAGPWQALQLSVAV